MTPDNDPGQSSGPPSRNPLEQAEDHFVSLAHSAGMVPWLGRFCDATEDELRCLFGLAVASIRRSQAALEAAEAAACRSAGEEPAPGAVSDLDGPSAPVRPQPRNRASGKV